MERDSETRLERRSEEKQGGASALIRGSIAHRAMWMWVVVTRPQP